MDLISAKVEAAERSRKEKKTVYLFVQDDGEVELSTKHPGPKATHCFKNGSEAKLEDVPVEASKPVEEPKSKKEKKVKTNKKAGGAKGSKTAKKTTDRKAVTGADAIKRLLGAGAKKVTLSVKKALEKSKDNYLYRASNGSPLGKYYLAEYKDKDAEIEFLVKAK